MIPRRPVQSRYAATARRTHLARQAALAALIVVPGIACGNNDAEVFSTPSASSDMTAPADQATAPADPTTAGTASDTVVLGTVVPGTVVSTAAPLPESTTADSAPATQAAPASSDGAVPVATEVAVSFSFVPESTGRRVNNPYIAVWVEDQDGALVKTVSIWYQQSSKGLRWLSDLPQWYAASGQATDLTMSGATRTAGDYTVLWDGTDLDGNPVVAGDYVLFVEAAREHGPYGITSSPITVGRTGFRVDLPADGELANVTAELVA